MPQEAKSMPAPAADKHALPGLVVDFQGKDPAETFTILEKAFDYRGDVTLTLKDGREVAGYLFDRRRGSGLNDSTLRLLPAGSEDKLSVPYASVQRITFSDRDPAAGKSFETWLKKYVEKKLAGESANIFNDPLE